MKKSFKILVLIFVVLAATGCSYQFTIAIDRAFTIIDDQCVMNKESILNTMNDSSADTVANANAVNSIVIMNCVLTEKGAKIVIDYDKMLMEKAGFTFKKDFTIER